MHPSNTPRIQAKRRSRVLPRRYSLFSMMDSKERYMQSIAGNQNSVASAACDIESISLLESDFEIGDCFVLNIIPSFLEVDTLLIDKLESEQFSRLFPDNKATIIVPGKKVPESLELS